MAHQSNAKFIDIMMQLQQDTLLIESFLMYTPYINYLGNYFKNLYCILQSKSSKLTKCKLSWNKSSKWK